MNELGGIMFKSAEEEAEEEDEAEEEEEKGGVRPIMKAALMTSLVLKVQITGNTAPSSPPMPPNI